MDFHRGEMFREAAPDAHLEALRRPPVVLDASLDAILRTLERFEKPTF